MKLLLCIISLFLSVACTKKDTYHPKSMVLTPSPKIDTMKVEAPKSDSGKIDSMVTPGLNSKTYLALGDSYTIGQSVTPAESYPYQLVKDLNKHSFNYLEPTIIARTGWTTGELKHAISTAALTQKFDVVTLLIGVNNQYRGYPKNEYRNDIVELLKTALNFADGKKEHVFVLSIPDWGVTPYGIGSNKNKEISTDIDAFNTIKKEEAVKMGIVFIDITTESRSALNDNTLIASDGLHPSARMYADWVGLVSPEIQRVVK